MKNIRISSAGQHYLTFVSRDTGEIMMGRFLPWSTLLLIITGSQKQKIKIEKISLDIDTYKFVSKEIFIEIEVMDFIFGELTDYSLVLDDCIINCDELWPS
jgi:hypothetical protein